MIKKISISGYKSIECLANFPLQRLNVLIGPNRGGKSNFLDFISLLGEAARGRLSKGLMEREGIGSVMWAGEEEIIPLQCELDIDFKSILDNQLKTIPSKSQKKKNVYSFELWRLSSAGYEIVEYFNDLKLREFSKINKVDFKIHDLEPIASELIVSQPLPIYQDNPFGLVGRFISKVSAYHYLDTSRLSRLRKPQIIETSLTEQDITLNENGDNLTNVYYHLFNDPENRDAKEEILTILQTIFQGFKEIIFPPIHGRGGIQLGWVEEHLRRPLYLSELSDGTIKFLCLLSILVNPHPPTVVCIDEPENSLHPEILNVLAELLVNASERMQIIVATHSPRLVTSCKPEDVVVVEPVNGASQFMRLKEKELEHWLRDFTLGELWEMGEIGGRM